MRVLGIDPGRSGAVAFLEISDTFKFHVELLETQDTLSLYDHLGRMFKEFRPHHVWVEQVGTGMPGNSARSTTAFARHCGKVDLAVELLAREYPSEVHFVIPSKWMQDTVGGSRPKGSENRNQRKKYIRQLGEFWLGEKFDKLDHADAAMIAVYGMRQVYGL